MKNTQNTSEQDTLHGNANETTKQLFGNEMLNVEKVPETPFTIVSYDDKYFVALGKYKMSDVFRTKEEALENVKDASWDRIMQVIAVTIEEYDRRRSTKDLQADMTEQEMSQLNLGLDKQK